MSKENRSVIFHDFRKDNKGRVDTSEPTEGGEKERVHVSLDMLRTPDETMRAQNIKECMGIIGQELLARSFLIPVQLAEHATRTVKEDPHVIQNMAEYDQFIESLKERGIDHAKLKESDIGPNDLRWNFATMSRDQFEVSIIGMHEQHIEGLTQEFQETYDAIRQELPEALFQWLVEFTNVSNKAGVWNYLKPKDGPFGKRSGYKDIEMPTLMFKDGMLKSYGSVLSVGVREHYRMNPHLRPDRQIASMQLMQEGRDAFEEDQDIKVQNLNPDVLEALTGLDDTYVRDRYFHTRRNEVMDQESDQTEKEEAFAEFVRLFKNEVTDGYGAFKQELEASSFSFTEMRALISKVQDVLRKKKLVRAF